MNLDDIFKRTHRYEREGTSITEVPEPERSIICVLAAFYPILNGGFGFLFEMEMVCGVKSNMLADAYTRIGLAEHSLGIKRVLSIFPESKPHDDLDEREKFLSKYFEEEDEDGNANEDYIEFIGEIECSFYGEGKEKVEVAIRKYYEQHI